MCNKMFKVYSRFVGDMSEHDPIMKIMYQCVATAAYREVTDGEGRAYPTNIAAITAGQMVPSTHKVQLIIGPRRSDFDYTIVTLTADEYNNTVRHRMTSAATSDSRIIAWRNYLIDNNLLPRFIEVYEKSIKNRVVTSHSSNFVSLQALKNYVERFMKPTHERIAA